jgi:hypothetical protein
MYTPLEKILAFVKIEWALALRQMAIRLGIMRRAEDNACLRNNTRLLHGVCIEEVQALPPTMRLPELVI